MKLLPEWRLILKKAWSIRLSLAAGMLTGVQVILPFFIDRVPVVLFAVLTFVFTAGAIVARFVAQENISGRRP